MDKAELRAAAELVLALRDDHENEVSHAITMDRHFRGMTPEDAENRMAEMICGMARHILATVRSDDGEPVTVDWIDSQTYLENRSSSPYQRNYEIVPTIRLVAVARPGGFDPCDLWIGGGESFTRRSVNRGQLRSLLTGLGIELKTSPTT